LQERQEVEQKNTETHKPELTSKGKQSEGSYIHSGSVKEYVDELRAKEKIRKSVEQQLKREKEAAELKECTFAPKTNATKHKRGKSLNKISNQ
jgi:hypothetical protein